MMLTSRDRFQFLLRAIALVAIGAAGPPASGQAARQESSTTIAAAVKKLKPGEFLWLPQVAPEGPVLVMVSLADQRAMVYRNGVPIGVSTISSGKKGHETPTGIFTILQRKTDHRSNLYNDAPMPYMQRLTWDGIALHGGRLPGYPASHGCIRLPLEFAKRLFGVTRLGITVIVTDEPVLPRIATSPDPLRFSKAGSKGGAATGDIVWQPQLAPDGPVSVIVSAADGRVIVLRNGREIGSAPVQITTPVGGTSAYTLQAGTTGAPEWLRVALPGTPTPPGNPLYRGKILIDDGFRRAVLAALRPGATVIVTADSLRRDPAGPGITLELAEPHE